MYIWRSDKFFSGFGLFLKAKEALKKKKKLQRVTPLNEFLILILNINLKNDVNQSVINKLINNNKLPLMIKMKLLYNIVMKCTMISVIMYIVHKTL